MKKIMAMILAMLTLMLAVVSCNGKGDPVVTQSNEQTTQTPEPSTPETEDPVDYKLLLSAPFTELAETDAAKFIFREENGGITITGYAGNEKRVRVPAEIDQKPVKAIADEVFRGHEEITTLYIPDTVEQFGKNILLGCKGIYALRTPLSTAEGTDYLGYLYGATSYEMNNTADLRTLAYLEIGGMASALPAYALYDCNDIVCIKLPQTMTVLSEYSLYLCESLKYLNAEHLTIVADYAMFGCGSMTDLAFGASLQKIGFAALKDCSSMRNLTLPFVGESRTEQMYLSFLFGATDPSLAEFYYPASLRTVRLLEGCTTIGDHAFFNCKTLKSVFLPSSVTSVGVRAFSGCAQMEALTFSDALTTVLENAFSNCSALKTVSLGSGLTVLGINAFLNCDALTEIAIHTPGLAALPSSCFVGCNSLQAVTLSGIKTVGSYAFSGCSALATVSLGDVTSVAENAFEKCDALTSVTANGKVSFADGNALAKSIWKNQK